MITNLPHSAKALESYNAIKAQTLANGANTVPEFKKFEDKDIEDMKLKGKQVKKITNGIHVRENDKEFLYDSINKNVENRIFEGNDLKFSHYQQFQKDKTGRTIPAYNRIIRMEKNEKGRRFWHFKEEYVINYKVGIPEKVQGLEIAGNTSNQDDKFAVYPNPVSNEMWVQIPINIYEKAPIIIIVDLLGKIVWQQKARYALESINTEQINAGIYFLNVETESGDKLTQRFIKQ